MTDAAGAIGVEPILVRCGDGTVAGLRARPDGEARAMIVALHGGGYDARYWHNPGCLPASLLAMGAALGFDVVAFDRPGYGGSAVSWPAGLAMADQAAMMFEAAGRVASSAAQPLFVIGHSMGGILAIHMGAIDDGRRLAGIDVSGVPLRFEEERAVALRDGLAALSAVEASHAPLMPPDARRAIFFGSDGTFDPALVARGDTEYPVPVVEVGEAVASPARLPALMERIVAPVQWTLADEERSSLASPEILAEGGRLLARSLRVRTAWQERSGHNISLHRVARAYHLRALAFFEECLAGL